MWLPITKAEPVCQNVILLFPVRETAKYVGEGTAVGENGSLRNVK